MNGTRLERRQKLQPFTVHPGTPKGSTACGGNVDYRLGKIERIRRIEGRWLDCGCGEGEYTTGLVQHGATHAVGVDASPTSITKACERAIAGTTFLAAAADDLPFPEESFDGILLNEVLEHVADEERVLRELRRLLVPGGYMFVFSPNRWFPFDGHGAVVGRVRLRFPVPFVPWLPMRLTRRIVEARNYWPRELRTLVASVGLEVVEVDFALPLFGVYPWLPSPVGRLFFAVFEPWRMLRRFGVSIFVAARRSWDR